MRNRSIEWFVRHQNLYGNSTRCNNEARCKTEAVKIERNHAGRRAPFAIEAFPSSINPRRFPPVDLLIYQIIGIIDRRFVRWLSRRRESVRADLWSGENTSTAARAQSDGCVNAFPTFDAVWCNPFIRTCAHSKCICICLLLSSRRVVGKSRDIRIHSRSCADKGAGPPNGKKQPRRKYAIN